MNHEQPHSDYGGPIPRVVRKQVHISLGASRHAKTLRRVVPAKRSDTQKFECARVVIPLKTCNIGALCILDPRRALPINPLWYSGCNQVIEGKRTMVTEATCKLGHACMPCNYTKLTLLLASTFT
jgi:hypothetical protein